MGCLITEVHTTITPISADVSLWHVSPVVSVEAKEYIPLDVSASVVGTRPRDFITFVPRPTSLGRVEFGMVYDVPANITHQWIESMVQE